MKTIKTLIRALVLLLVMSLPSYAAFTFTGTTLSEVHTVGMDVYHVLSIVCISDGSALTNQPLDSTIGLNALQLKLISGGVLNSVTTIPSGGAQAPTTAYTITLKNGSGATVFNKANRSTTATEIVSGAETVGIFPALVGTPTLTLTDFGDSGDTVTIKLEIWSRK